MACLLQREVAAPYAPNGDVFGDAYDACGPRCCVHALAPRLEVIARLARHVGEERLDLGVLERLEQGVEADEQAVDGAVPRLRNASAAPACMAVGRGDRAVLGGGVA